MSNVQVITSLDDPRIEAYRNLKDRDVAREGDRFDYWVGDENQEWGMEVSGTLSESLEERQAEKISQLLSNPYGVDGFVIVVRFASQEAWFTFHRVQERGSRRAMV